MAFSYGQRTASKRTINLPANSWVEIPQQTDAVSVEAFRVAYQDGSDAPPPDLGFGGDGELWWGIAPPPWIALENNSWALNCAHNSFDATRMFVRAPVLAQFEYEHAEYQCSYPDD